MAATTDVKVHIKPTAGVEVGFASKLGVVLSLLATVGAVAGALASNDTATVTAGTAGALVALTTLGGRFAQAVAMARVAARMMLPIIETVAQEDPPDRAASS